ncbi:arsenic resistance N-acetyltransferase ArsN2 [Sphingomonas oryzagri]|uniref:Arsenic resistance N-acetyltransferase ArsN2 n=1 Tax=Sphingomonas oryzagri TaxID=3042314 RepID=A0ABT6N1M7_9SPHN|nr:arsenic resistance N-acetyltransferase ArsN2 [Sphingomonas oryzagri]MDH7638286.1 arsenic resistance N-acetyltransferase ArsN2 [Sphingomonas oryzagri]
MKGVIFAPLDSVDDALARALDAAGLPTDDLHEPGRAFFRLSDDAGAIGFVGIEGIGVDRLLRSLVVLPRRRRQGFGALLVNHAEASARQDGTERLHLLTQTSSDFFHAHGYRRAERSSAPASIGSTAQFTSLCPASAAYLVKDLA